MDNNKDYDFRVISNQVRFGCGYRTVNGKRQYFAWHGVPSRNDDYFTTSLISEVEYKKSARSTRRRSSPTERPRSASAPNTWAVIL